MDETESHQDEGVSEDAMPYRWWRYPSARGVSFPVKRSTFEVALAQTPLKGLHAVVLTTHGYRDPAAFFQAVGIPQPRGIDDADFRVLATATWTGLEGTPPPRTAWISFYAVPSEERAEIRAIMEADGMPKILAWLRDIETGAQTRRDAVHRLALYLSRGRLESTAT